MGTLLRALTVLMLTGLAASAQIVPLPGAGVMFRQAAAVSGGGGGGIAQVQKKSYASTASATSHTASFDNTPTQNNVLIAVIASDTVVSGVSGWTQASSAVNYIGFYCYWKKAGAAESKNVVVSLGSSDCAAIQLYEYSGLTGSLDKTASSTPAGSVSSISTGTTATTTAANELVVAAVSTTSNGSTATVSSWSNSFTTDSLVATTGSTVNVNETVALRVVSATGAYTSTATMGNATSNPSGLIATFK